MNQVLKEIDCGRLFPASSYYKQQRIDLEENNQFIKSDFKEDKSDVFASKEILVSENILKKFDILKDINTCDDQKMLSALKALDNAHTNLNQLSLQYFHSTMDDVESNSFIKEPLDIQNAEIQVKQCYVENSKTPLNCAQQVKQFLEIVKMVNKDKENIFPKKF